MRTPAAEREDGLLEPAPQVGQLVDRSARGRRENGPPDDSAALELFEPAGEQVRADPWEAGEQILVALRSEEQLADEQQGPTLADEKVSMKRRFRMNGKLQGQNEIVVTEIK